MNSNQPDDTAPIIPTLSKAEYAKIRALYISLAKEQLRKSTDIEYWCYCGAMCTLRTVFGDEMFKDIHT